MRVAVLDLGSTSLRLVVADWVPTVGLVPHVQRRERLNLGMVVGQTGRIPEPYADAAVRAVTKLRRRAEAAGADRVVAVATSALRDARNREKVARRMAAAAGVPVRILSGDEEAALTYAAIRAALPSGREGEAGRGPRDGPLLGIDLGGGSLELAVGTGGLLEWTASLGLGASRLVGSFLRSDPVLPQERDRLAAHVKEQLRSLPPIDWPAWCVAAGGSVKAIARLLMASDDAGNGVGQLNGVRLEAADIATLADRLLAMDPRQRARVPGMDRHRSGVVATAALVVAMLLDQVGVPAISVSEWGLREGVILEALELASAGVPATLGAGYRAPAPPLPPPVRARRPLRERVPTF